MSELDPLSDALEGVTFVEASAGTGKTYAIEMFYLRLLVEDGLSPEQIVVVTYTNAAAAELRKRIRARLRAAQSLLQRGAGEDEPWAHFVLGQADPDLVRQRLLTALYCFDQAAIYTIHGFCQRVLVEHAFDSGVSFDLEMIVDQTALVDEVSRDFVARRLSSVERPLLDAVWDREALGVIARFVSLVSAQPDLRLMPPAFDWAAERERWLDVLSEARTLWANDGEKITELRCTSRSLRVTSRMKAAKFESAIEAITVGAGLLTNSGRKELEALSSGKLASVTTKGNDPPQHAFFDRCQELWELWPRVKGGFSTDLFQNLAVFGREQMKVRKEQARVAYFDDLLIKLHEALSSASGERLANRLRQRFAAALIDEFQDTDPVQYEIFKKVFVGQGQPLMLIGDPKQSIYGFRGGDIHTYVRARSDADRRSTLGTNRRSGDNVVQAVNALFDRENAFVDEAIKYEPVRPVGGVPGLDGSRAGLTILRSVPDKGVGQMRNVKRGIASRVVRLLNSGATIDGVAVGAGDLAVLCRTNQQAAEVQEELRRRSVPSVLQGDRSVFGTPEAAELVRVLRGLVDPHDSAAMRAAMCTSLCGLQGGDLYDARDDESLWQDWVDRFRGWRARWDEHGFTAAFRALQDDCATAGRLLAESQGERSLTNYLHLGELLQIASRRQRSGPQGLVDWLALMINDASARAELATEDVQVRLESDADAVVLTTVHKSKGLEYPIVFAPYLWAETKLMKRDGKQPRYYDEELGGRCVYVSSVDNDAARAAAEREQLGEAMRLAYVALTRAKSAVFVVTTAEMDGEKSPLGRLLSKGVEQLVTDAGGAVAVEDLEISLTSLIDGSETVEIAQPPTPPAISRGWRVSSFSGLTRKANLPSQEGEDAVDRDQDGDLAPPAGVTGSPGIALADLEAGTRVGLMLHSVFEDLDFYRGDAESLRTLVEQKVGAFRCGTGSVDVICRSVSDILETPLASEAATISLSQVERGHRLDELEFILPVVPDGGQRLTADRLAQVLANHGAPVSSPGYATRVAELDFKALAGFLRGYIDMVFAHAGRWYVVDYKSNHLGTSWSDYRPEVLVEPMSHHDYYLQYLLYVVATDRYLAHRVVGYSYETHFGGVFYLFLRGMAPDRPGSGVFFDLPTPELVADLSELFRGPLDG